jgi:hypothetical protein
MSELIKWILVQCCSVLKAYIYRVACIFSFTDFVYLPSQVGVMNKKQTKIEQWIIKAKLKASIQFARGFDTVPYTVVVLILIFDVFKASSKE